MIDFRCQRCRTPYRIPDEEANDTFTCRACGSLIQVLAAVPLDPAEPPVPAVAGPEIRPGDRSADGADGPARGARRSIRRWYYKIGGEVFGPVTEGQLLAAAEDGTVRPDTPVRADGTTWQPARDALPHVFAPDAPGGAWGTPRVVAIVVANAVVALAAFAGVYAYLGSPRPAERATGEARAPAEPGPAPAPGADDRALTAEGAYQRLLHSTVFILCEDGDSVSCGSGALVHQERRLVLTNFHVVGRRAKVQVFFPAYNSSGELVTDPKYYCGPKKSLLRVWGRVLARNSRVDLAVVELDSVSDRAVVLPLAAKPAATGAALFSVGASGIDLRTFGGALWRLSAGTARNRFHDTVSLETGQHIEAKFLESQKPINAGDSGGPTINDRGELVGVVCASDPRKDAVKLDIDLEEVQTFLAEVAKANGWVWQNPAHPALPGPAGAPAPAAPPPDEIQLAVARATGAGEPDKRVAALAALGALGPKAQAAVPRLLPLLDDPNERVRRATAAALEAVGPPAPADAPAIAAALAGTRPFARVYALNYFAARRAERSQVPHLLAALDADVPEVRGAALRAVARYGPDCKPEAQGKLFARLLDADPAVARLAAGVLVLFLKPNEDRDRELLVAHLTHAQWPYRLLSVQVLGKLTVDDPTALAWFRPRFGDSEPAVRAAAVAALARRKAGVRAIAPDLLERTFDNDLGVQLAAARGLGDIGGGPAVVAGLARLLDPGTDPRLRAAAVRALARVELADPARELPVLEKLLAEPDPSVRVAVLTRFAALGADGVPFLKSVGACLRDPDAAVRAAALKAVAASGPALAAAAAKPKDGAAARQTAEALAARAAELATRAADAPARPGTREPLAERLARSAVWVCVADSAGRKLWNGSGVLVDAAERLVLTTYHVGHPDHVPVVFFPHAPEGRRATEPDYYVKGIAQLRRTRHAQVGRVVWSDSLLDLSLVQFDQAPPDEARAVALAAAPAEKGQALYAVGHSAEALWRPLPPTRAGAASECDVLVSAVQPVRCRVLETGWALAPEDSGSAVVNERGELVALNGFRAPGAPGASYAIDLSVLRAVEGVPPTAPPAADPVPALALDALARLGRSGHGKLVEFLAMKIPLELRNDVIDRLGTLGAELPNGVAATLLFIAETDTAVRPKISDALTRCGTDDVSAALRKKYKWSRAEDKTRRSELPVEYHVWLLGVLAELPIKNLSDQERNQLRSYLTGHGLKDPDPDCKAAAQRALTHLDTLLGTKK